MIDTCYVIHITLVTYCSVAATVEAPLLESHRSVVVGAVVGVLAVGVPSLECHH